MSKVSFALLIHSHQPVGNFEHVFEQACQKAYEPFLEILFRHPRIRVNLHYSGILLEWVEGHHPELFRTLRELAGRGQVELVGGGYYEPILPAIPDADKVLQIRKLSEYLRTRFAVTPRGAWLAERVWEPGLARPLAEAGVEYTLLDDTHFIAAGLESSQLRGVYITEEVGFPLRLVPSLKVLRYMIPFREPEETLKILSEGLAEPGALFAMGDDGEKFGVWPGTFDHCYTHGWLERFLQALENSDEWLETVLLSDFLAAHPPERRIYLPTASYEEMMEWSLPGAASAEFRACLEETERLPSGQRFRRFLRGGLWRNFLSKYPESNQLHKLMIEASRRCHQAALATSGDSEASRRIGEAQEHLLAAQCNDAYWHGIFGGTYAPHLRAAVLRHLIQAESLLDPLESNRRELRITESDFDADGHEELHLEHPAFGMVVRPADGATVSSLRFKPRDSELINSLMRRPEPYHEKVRRHASSSEGLEERPASIHDRVLSKESNLAALLRYDRYARHCFRTYVFPASKQWQDFDALSLGEIEDLARGTWTARPRDQAGTLEFRREVEVSQGDRRWRLRAGKIIRAEAAKSSWRLECRSELASDQPLVAPYVLGVEMVLNLLAPSAPDRYFLAGDTRYPLEFKGEIGGPQILLVDEWQGLKVSLEGLPLPRWWIVPVETISQSESGFERVYQGSAMLAVWSIDSLSKPSPNFLLRAEITKL